MGKIKAKTRFKLIPAYVMLAVLFLVGAMCVADFERGYINDVQMSVAQKYTDNVESFNDFKVWDKNGNEYIMSDKDSRKMQRLDLFAYIFPHMDRK